MTSTVLLFSVTFTDCFRLCWVSAAAWRLSGCSAEASPRSGFSYCGAWAQRVWPQWAQRVGAAGVAPRLQSSALACGIFLGQGADLCLLHWQAAAFPLSSQGSPDLGGFEDYWSGVL